MKKLKFKVGDVLTLKEETYLRNRDNSIVYRFNEYHVVKVNRKSIVLYRYPTYEKVVIKL